MMLRTALTAPLALCALLTALTAPAAAMPGRVPPGNSGAVQYTETLPGVGGDQTTRGLREGQGAGRGAGKALGAADAARLEALGAEGADAARLAAGGAPPGAAGGGGEGSSAAGGDSALGQVLRAATGASGPGGMGLLLPLLIAAGVLASLAFLASRRRAGPPSDPAG